MSAFSEYMKLIPKGIQNADKIVKGIINSTNLENLPEEQKDEIIKRRVICQGCPYMSENAKTSPEFYELLGYNYTTARPDKHCTFCGCPLSFRTASLEKNCGIEDWNEANPTHPLELKWNKVENH